MIEPTTTLAEIRNRSAAHWRVMHAAEDLLAACEAVAKALEYRNASPDPKSANYVNPLVVATDQALAEKKVREAIAKAKGETP